MPIFSNQGAQDAADYASQIGYDRPSAGYLGFGNNQYNGLPGGTPGYGGDYLDPGETGGNALGILMAQGMTAEQAQAYLAAQATGSSGNGSVANFAHSTGQFLSSPLSWLWNHTGGLIPGATQASYPTDAFGSMVQSGADLLGGYHNPGAAGSTPAQGSSFGMGSDLGSPATSFGMGGDLGTGSGNPGYGYGYTGSPNSGPVTAGSPYFVNGGGSDPSYQFPGSAPSYGGSSLGTPSSGGFDPNGANTLPAVNVTAPKYVPQTLSPPPIDTYAPPPQTDIPGAGGIQSPGINLPPTTTTNPPTTTPTGGDYGFPGGGGGTSGTGTGTGTSGDRNALTEGLAQNAAEAGLAPQQLSQYQQFSPQYAAQDAANIGTSLFGAGGPTNIADQYARLTQGQQDPLLAQQNQIASGLLNQGGNLSASDLRNVQQSSRAGYAARGLDATNSSIVDEAMQTDAAQRARLLQNLGIAQNVVGQNQSAASINNANSQSLFGLASGLTNASNQYTRNQFDAFSPYGADVASSNFNANQAQKIQQQNNALALTIAGQNADAAKSAATTSTLGNIFGTWLGRCWIAREVFGSENPEWKEFRLWLDTLAPSWFRNWYLKNGRWIAAFLKVHPFLKPLIRSWMRCRIIELKKTSFWITHKGSLAL